MWQLSPRRECNSFSSSFYLRVVLLFKCKNTKNSNRMENDYYRPREYLWHLKIFPFKCWPDLRLSWSVHWVQYSITRSSISTPNSQMTLVMICLKPWIEAGLSVQTLELKYPCRKKSNVGITHNLGGESTSPNVAEFTNFNFRHQTVGYQGALTVGIDVYALSGIIFKESWTNDSTGLQATP